jgi:hypothetical protein
MYFTFTLYISFGKSRVHSQIKKPLPDTLDMYNQPIQFYPDRWTY